MTDKLENYYETWDYGSREPLQIKMEELTDREKDLLIKSDVFCMLPWIHLHAYPDGRAYPCCLAKYENHVGSLRENTMEEIWRDKPMQQLRDNMLNESKSEVCSKCYEQEESGFFSMRNSSNQTFGHHIKTLDSDEFKIRYYDIRFSNLCNLACRSCGDVFSSNWVKEGKKMKWLKPDHPNVSYAGKHETDAWEQLLPHIPYIEEVYFAGGEPLMMKEHYDLLNELLKQGRNDVKLVYNTNFTELVFKGNSVLPMWNEFETVSIGASLDASYERAELMRKGTVWSQTVKNREEMLKVCPTVDFYVSSTLSIMNSYHIPDFHKEWIELGLVRPGDWNINILQSPEYYRIDVLPQEMKEQIVEKYAEHIEYLEPIDEISRAIKGYKAAVQYLTNTDNTKLIPELIQRLGFLDRYRNENFFAVFPELERLNKYA